MKKIRFSSSTPLLGGGYVFALILPPLGLVLGIVLAVRWGRRGHGLAVSLLSAVVLVTLIVVENQDDESSPPPPAAVKELDKFTDCLEDKGFSSRATEECEGKR